VQITRSDIIPEGLNEKLIVDFILDNEEAQAVAEGAAVGALAIPPPYGEIVAIVIAKYAEEIRTKNLGRGGGREHSLSPGARSVQSSALLLDVDAGPRDGILRGENLGGAGERTQRKRRTR
jgi:hypothetical protein